MAPLSEALAVNFNRILGDGTRIYAARLDPAWTVASMSHGGYLLGVILEAVIHFQSTTKQPDPIHLTSHFYLPTRPGSVEVHVKSQRQGRRFSNISADLFQDGNMNVTTHIIVGTLLDPFIKANDKSSMTILPPHPFAARIPFRTHPAIAEITSLPSKLTFQHYLKASQDPTIHDRYYAKANRDDGEGGFDYGAWYELLGEKKGQRLGLSAMGFFSDMCRSTPAVLPPDDRPDESWHPTLTLSLEFKAPLSSLAAGSIAPHTFGVFSTGRFIHAGRHETHTEVWTAPSGLAVGKSIATGDPNWRDNMMCIAIASQMALTLPIGVATKTEGKASKL